MLSKDKYFFRVHTFINADTGMPLPQEEVEVRYITDCPIPHWIDEKTKKPTKLSQELGEAIEATAIGKEYIALCFLRTIN